MPIFNFDFDAAEARLGIPSGASDARAVPVSVCDRLRAIQESAAYQEDKDVPNLHGAASAALAILAAPACVGLGSVRITLRQCTQINALDMAVCPMLPGAGSTPEPQRTTYQLLAGWYRNAGERWLLGGTADDMARAAQQDGEDDRTASQEGTPLVGRQF